MNYNFINYIKSIVDIPKEQENKFCSLISVKQIKKGENLFNEGQSSRTIAFVKSGLFRYRAFLQQFPNLEKRIKQHIIASYFRLAPESLSRIKKNT